MPNSCTSDRLQAYICQNICLTKMYVQWLFYKNVEIKNTISKFKTADKLKLSHLTFYGSNIVFIWFHYAYNKQDSEQE